MQKQSIYKDLARYYDLIYSWKDYEKEAVAIRWLISRYQESEDKELLEVACGTGKHAQYLKSDFDVLATDVNAEMLEVAQRNIGGVVFKQADMVSLNLGKDFDVIICLFSAIGYVRTYSNLKNTLANFASHLKEGGVVIIEPWFTRSAYETGWPHLSTYGDENIKIARACVSRARRSVSVMDMHYLIAEKDKDVKHIVDRHELGMFEPGKFLQFMDATGLKAKFLKNGLMKGRGIYVGVKV